MERMDANAGGGMDALWREGGVVAAAVGDGYAPRQEQIRYADTISLAIARDRERESGILLIEGGTGIGKTLGYLIPSCMEIAERGGRVLVATHTLALMRQIVTKEAPTAIDVVRRALGKPLRLAELRGRRNFASPLRCRALAETMKMDGLAEAAAPLLELADRAERAARQAGRMLDAEGDGPGAADVVHAALIDVFAADRGIDLPAEDVCLLASSDEWEQAPYLLARSLAEAADVLVTTHAMTATALARRTVPGVDSADHYRVLIVDEADRWAAAAESVAFSYVSLDAVDRAISKLIQAARLTASAQAVSFAAVEAIDAVERMRSIAPTDPGSVCPLGDAGSAALADLRSALSALERSATPDRKSTASASGLVGEFGRGIDRALRAIRSGGDFWKGQLVASRIHAKPSVRVMSAAPGRIMKRLWAPAAGESPLAKSVIITSATLATPGYGREARWGAISAATGVASDGGGNVHHDLMDAIHPAEYGTMRLRFADPAAPVPAPGASGVLGDDAVQYVVDTIRMARAQGGRVLVQVPSYADVERLAPFFNDAILHRRGASLRESLAAYRADPAALLISPAVWLGVDLPGLVDQQVVMRLPFPPRQEGEGPGAVAAIGQMLQMLAQGLGRGIRRADDAVTVWIADPRLPPPDTLLGREMLLAHPASKPQYLSAIPERFRRRFGEPGMVEFGVRVAGRPKGKK